MPIQRTIKLGTGESLLENYRGRVEINGTTYRVCVDAMRFGTANMGQPCVYGVLSVEKVVPPSQAAQIVQNLCDKVEIFKHLLYPQQAEQREELFRLRGLMIATANYDLMGLVQRVRQELPKQPEVLADDAMARQLLNGIYNWYMPAAVQYGTASGGKR